MALGHANVTEMGGHRQSGTGTGTGTSTGSWKKRERERERGVT